MLSSSASSRTATGLSAGRFGQPEINVSVCLDNGTPIPAQVVELARQDLMLLTDRPLKFGTPIQLALFSDLISAITCNRAIVHWARPHSRGWQIGAFLTQPLPDRLTEQSWNEIRNTLRYECNWKAWVRWEGGGELESVRVLNYSITGLRMRVARSVEVNSRFSLFGSSGMRDNAVVDGQVQWCREADDTFQIGGIIRGQKGRDLPRTFGNAASVHVKPSQALVSQQSESLDTLRCEQQCEEQFLPRPRV